MKNIKKYYVYRHIRLDKNVPFYVGVGTVQNLHSTTHTNIYKRAYTVRSKNNLIWHHIIAKTDYRVEIIWETDNYSEALNKEIEFIKLYGRIDLKTGTLANLTDGGEGNTNRVWTNEQKEKLRQANLGKKHSEATKNKLKTINIGKKVPPEIREKIGLSHKGKKMSEEAKKKLSVAKKGKKYQMRTEKTEKEDLNQNIEKM